MPRSAQAACKASSATAGPGSLNPAAVRRGLRRAPARRSGCTTAVSHDAGGVRSGTGAQAGVQVRQVAVWHRLVRGPERRTGTGVLARRSLQKTVPLCQRRQDRGFAQVAAHSGTTANGPSAPPAVVPEAIGSCAEDRPQGLSTQVRAVAGPLVGRRPGCRVFLGVLLSEPRRASAEPPARCRAQPSPCAKQSIGTDFQNKGPLVADRASTLGVGACSLPCVVRLRAWGQVNVRRVDWAEPVNEPALTPIPVT